MFGRYSLQKTPAEVFGTKFSSPSLKDNTRFTYRHNDNEASRYVSVEEVIPETPFQFEDHFQTSEVTWKNIKRS